MFNWIKKAKTLFSSGVTTESGLVKINDDGFMSDDISVSIEDIVSEDDHEDIGKIFVLSLTEFHQALGETWDKREAKIFLLAESVLRQRIGVGNRWEHQSKEIYILIFPTLPELEGAARTYDIAEELGLKIIGERFDGSSRPLIRVAGVDPKDAIGPDGKLDIEKLEKAGRSGQSAGDSTNVAGQTKAGTTIIHEKDQAETITEADLSLDWKKNPHKHVDHDGDWIKNEHHSQEHDTDWQKNVRQTPRKVDPNWQEMNHPAPKKEKGPQWVSMKEDEPQKPAKPAPSTVEKKPSYGLTFAPCWDRASQSLTIYRAILTYGVPGEKLLEGNAAYVRHVSAEQRLKIDIWLLQKSARALFSLMEKEIITPVFIPVHSSSLRAKERASMLAMIQKFTPHLRESYFIIEIMDDGLWRDEDLQEAIDTLKPMVRNIAFTPSSDKHFDIPAVTSLDWIGLDLATLDEHSGITPDGLISLQKETQQHHAKSYLFGVSKRAEIADFLEMGTELISGKALVRTTDKLRPPFNLPEERLRA
ncbi:MAG: hypothetical protein HWE30_01350 [Methylocystaceae bacterium]|nr:hypothetical protein [Methylocystaceae bacterium]